MRIIARVRPSVLAINGGDGTVQATLTELYNGGHFEGDGVSQNSGRIHPLWNLGCLCGQMMVLRGLQ